jgi:Lrp/AsnC family transcriptional regulator, leucine-responsive regulatory protein
MIVLMDSLERKILGLLAKDSERSLQDMATEVGIPSSTLHQKIRKLETKGTITGYQARLDLRAIGLKTTSFVSLTPIDPAAPDNVPEQLSSIPEIEGCWSVAGAASYIVKVNVSEPADLEKLLASIRAAANVRTETTVVLSTAFENRPPAIPAGEQ